MFKTICLKKLSIAVALLTVAAGCATTPMETLRISLTDSGRILVNGKSTTLASVGSAVKRSGAKPQTMIEVSVPPTASSTLCRSIKSNLAKAGYPRIFFVRGRRSTAFVNEDQDKKK